MRIQHKKTSTVKPYKNNARKIPPEAVAAVSESLKEFGWQQPIVVDTNDVIIAGHTRHLAAKKAGTQNRTSTHRGRPNRRTSTRIPDRR